MTVAEALRVAASALATARKEAAEAEKRVIALATRADAGDPLPTQAVARRLRQSADRLADAVAALHDAAREIHFGGTPPVGSSTIVDE